MLFSDYSSCINDNNATFKNGYENLTSTNIAVLEDNNEGNKSEGYKSNNDSLYTEPVTNYKFFGSLKDYGRNKYLLPKVDSFIYVPVNSVLNLQFFKYKSKDFFEDSIPKYLKYYQKKLSNIGKFQAYFIEVNCHLNKSAKCFCNEGFLSLAYDFLVLYDPSSRDAYLINVSYDFSSDIYPYSMSFLIKNNNEILLQESYLEEGESVFDGNSIIVLAAKHTIRISEDGELFIEENK
ncbi:MAG: hypothetical protein NVV82_26770 [Sporocytophaga sp.]|nr:hypothetical protein [Sporocytophaga sp.]